MADSLPLPQEILLHVFELLEDHQTLFNCSIANRELGRLANKVLYAHVGHSLRREPVLSLKSRDKIAEPSALISSMLPHNSPHVLKLEIRGFLSTRPYPFNPLPETLSTAIRVYHNLRSIILTPTTYHPDTFADVLVHLRHLPNLEEVDVNPSCTDEEKAPSLAALCRLTKLTIRDPTRAILQLFPEWLEALAPTLRSFHLKGNCGSITPGVLRGFVKHLQAITSLSLGLSYSLSDQDVFHFLGQLASLEQIQLQYYLQFNTPEVVPAYPHLKSLSIKHAAMDTREDVDRLCSWIRRIITSSTQLECLELLGDKSVASVSFDGLVEHICHKHGPMIKSLDLGTAFVGAKAIKLLCSTCSQLEELRLASSLAAIVTFREMSRNLRHLHSFSIYIRNAPKRRCHFDEHAIQSIFQDSSESLRRVTINDIAWEGKWIIDRDAVTFSILQVIERPLPWDRPT